MWSTFYLSKNLQIFYSFFSFFFFLFFLLKFLPIPSELAKWRVKPISPALLSLLPTHLIYIYIYISSPFFFLFLPFFFNCGDHDLLSSSVAECTRQLIGLLPSSKTPSWLSSHQTCCSGGAWTMASRSLPKQFSNNPNHLSGQCEHFWNPYSKPFPAIAIFSGEKSHRKIDKLFHATETLQVDPSQTGPHFEVIILNSYLRQKILSNSI